MKASQLALAWVLVQGKDLVPIPATKHVKSLEENIAAADIRLSPEEQREIDAIASKGVAAGTRYAEAGMKSVHR